MRLFRLIAAAALSLIPALVLAQGAVAPGWVPNHPSNDNSTAPANTAYVDAASQTLLNAIGSRAPLANPVFSGTVTAPSFSGDGSGLSVAVPGALIARTLSRRFQDVINVRDFGAVGDGVADDTAAIVAAVSAASARKVTTDTYGAALPSVCFPGGVYHHSGFDIPGTRFVLKPCDGAWGSVTLTLKAGSNRSAIRSLAVPDGTVQPNYNFPMIEGLIVNGNRAQQTGTSHCIEYQDDSVPSFTEYRRAGIIKNVHALECLGGSVYAGTNRNGLVVENFYGERNASGAILYGYDNQFTNGGMGHSSGPVIDIRDGGGNVFVNVNSYGGNTGFRVAPAVRGYVFFLGGSLDGHRQGAAQIFGEGGYITGATLPPSVWTTSTVYTWTASTAYTVGQRRINNRELYEATTAGTSAASGPGPSGTGTGISDGTVVWKWVNSQLDRSIVIADANIAGNAIVGDGQYPAIALFNGASVTVSNTIFMVNGAATANPATSKNRYGYLVEHIGNGFGNVYWRNNRWQVVGDNNAVPWTVRLFSHPQYVIGDYQESVANLGSTLTSPQPGYRIGTNTGSAAGLILNAAAGGVRWLMGQTAGVARMSFGLTSEAETGSNAGSNVSLTTYSDAGSTLRQDLGINRATGAWTLGGPLGVNASTITLGQNTTPFSSIVVNGAAGTSRGTIIQSGGSTRWAAQATKTGETGANSGSDYAISAFSDVGALLMSPLVLSRATGAATFGGAVRVGGLLTLKPYVVATLPTCNTAARDTLAVVTDATSPTYRGALTGGGSVRTPVYCDGAAWTAH